MERRKKSVFICLYIVLWLAQAWLALVRRAPYTAVVLAVIYILVLTERKLSHYILYGWCGFGAVIVAGNIYADYGRRPSEEIDVLVLILALTVASIILTVLFRRSLKAAGEEKERAQTEKRRRRLDAKVAREQRGKGRSE